MTTLQMIGLYLIVTNSGAVHQVGTFRTMNDCQAASKTAFISGGSKTSIDFACIATASRMTFVSTGRGREAPPLTVRY